MKQHRAFIDKQTLITQKHHCKGLFWTLAETGCVGEKKKMDHTLSYGLFMQNGTT